MNAMLTMNGYRLQKTDVDLPTLKRVLTVKPSIPSVFVNPRYVTSYPVYQETESSIYVPKQYGITTYGVPSETSRDVPETSSEFWSFNGSIRPEQREVVDSFLQPTPHDGIISLQTGGGKTVCALYIAAQLRLLGAGARVPASLLADLPASGGQPAPQPQPYRAAPAGYQP